MDESLLRSRNVFKSSFFCKCCYSPWLIIIKILHRIFFFPPVICERFSDLVPVIVMKIQRIPEQKQNPPHYFLRPWLPFKLSLLHQPKEMHHFSPSTSIIHHALSATLALFAWPFGKLCTSAFSWLKVTLKSSAVSPPTRHHGRRAGKTVAQGTPLWLTAALDTHTHIN